MTETPHEVGRHDEDGKPYLAYFRNDLILGFIWSGSLNDEVQVQREMGEPILATFPITGDEMWQARQAHSLESDSTQIVHAFGGLCDRWIDKAIPPGNPIRPGPERLEQELEVATDRSVATEEQEVKTAVKLMCLRAQIIFGEKARYIVLDDSDQGTWAVVLDVQDEDGDGLTEDGYWDDGDEYAMHLYDNRAYLWLPFLQEGTWGGKRNPSRGILDIEKVFEAVDRGEL